MTRYYVDQSGAYIGGFEGVEPPGGVVEVPTAPNDARQIWDGAGWGDISGIAPNRVTARQFKLQLLDDGLLDQVEGWIATQPQAVQIAYHNSGTFVRDEPMMQAGFAALGFTPERVDAFFTAAAGL